MMNIALFEMVGGTLRSIFDFALSLPKTIDKAPLEKLKIFYTPPSSYVEKKVLEDDEIPDE